MHDADIAVSLRTWCRTMAISPSRPALTCYEKGNAALSTFGLFFHRPVLTCIQVWKSNA
jgi:hypothetical protein